jgi:predicted transcriptional regulator
MKCLSLKQPYAELLVRGDKTIELRKWNTKFRGKFLVHASQKTDLDACKRFKINPEELSNGAIIGSAQLYKIKTYNNKNEFLKDSGKHFADYKEFHDSKYGFLLKNAKRLKKPISYKGMLNFFDVGAIDG